MRAIMLICIASEFRWYSTRVESVDPVQRGEAMLAESCSACSVTSHPVKHSRARKGQHGFGFFFQTSVGPVTDKILYQVML